jgi:hypothetical protein
MTEPNSASANAPKPGKGQFRCYSCRNIYPMKEGDWFEWSEMEVHLCRDCQKKTQDRPERRKR